MTLKGGVSHDDQRAKNPNFTASRHGHGLRRHWQRGGHKTRYNQIVHQPKQKRFTHDQMRFLRQKNRSGPQAEAQAVLQRSMPHEVVEQPPGEN